jgi:hypothetical protein
MVEWRFSFERKERGQQAKGRDNLYEEKKRTVQKLKL